MRVLTVSHTAGSSQHGMLFRPFYLSREFIQCGHEASIVSASYFHTRQINPVVERDMLEEELDGVRFIWLKTINYGTREALRAIGMLWFAIKVLWYARDLVRTCKPDVVIASSPDPLVVFGAWRIAQLSGARFVFEFRDIWPLTLVELSGKPRWHPFMILLAMAERFGLKRADLVISVLANADAYLREIRCIPRRFAVVANGVSPEEWADAKFHAKSPLRSKLDALRQEGKFVLVYAGHHGVATALEPLVEAMALLQDSQIALVLVGHGPDKSDLEAKVQRLGLSNVFFFPPVPRRRIAAVLAASDACYVGSQPTDLYRFGLSFNKIFDYMMAGRPIVSALSAADDPISAAGCGVRATGHSIEEIADAIRQMAAMPLDQRTALGERGRAFVMKEHDYARLAERYLGHLAALGAAAGVTAFAERAVGATCPDTAAEIQSASLARFDFSSKPPSERDIGIPR